MASGTISLSSSKAWEGIIRWSSTQNIAGNYSDVYVYAGMWKTDGYLTSSNSSTYGSITINGSNYDLIGVQQFKTEVCIFESTIRVYHDADGTKSFTISLICHGQSGTSLSGHTLEGSGTAKMDTIPRKSSFAATDAAIGSVSNITIYREASTLYHRIKAEFGSVSGYVTNSGGFSSSAATITGTSVGFTIPNDFYYAIPSAKKGTCKLTLYTISGGTVIGDPVTTNITITTVSERCNPTLTIELSNDASDTSNLTGSTSKFIRGYSDLNCNVAATGRYGATITRIWTTAKNTNNGNGSYTILNIESNKITFYATDSRGYTGSKTITVTLVPYIVLTNNAIAGRPNPTDGSAFIQFQGSYFNDTFGAVHNELSILYRIEYPDGTIDQAWTPVTPTISGSTYSARLPFSGFDYTKSYKFHTYVSDKLISISKEILLKQGIPVFDWGKNDFQINVPAYVQGYEIMPEVLYMASSDTVGADGDVTLSADVSEFIYIEVFYCDNNGRGSDSVKILSPEGKQFTLLAIEPNGGSAFYFRRSGYTVSGNKITYAKNGGYAYFNGSTWTAYTGNYVRITGVLGHHRSAANIAPVLSPLIEQSPMTLMMAAADESAFAKMAVPNEAIEGKEVGDVK